jgi:acyl-CoA thioester hydrolase
MISEKTKIRVRYSETDQMGFVYYGNYATYLEVGRVAVMKKAGISYRKLEDEGIGLPVREMNIKYKQAALYDDEIEVTTYIREMPNRLITFDYEIKRGKELLITASTTLFFMEKATKRLIRMPEAMHAQLKPFFS